MSCRAMCSFGGRVGPVYKVVVPVYCLIGLATSVRQGVVILGQKAGGDDLATVTLPVLVKQQKEGQDQKRERHQQRPRGNALDCLVDKKLARIINLATVVLILGIDLFEREIDKAITRFAGLLGRRIIRRSLAHCRQPCHDNQHSNEVKLHTDGTLFLPDIRFMRRANSGFLNLKFAPLVCALTCCNLGNSIGSKLEKNQRCGRRTWTCMCSVPSRLSVVKTCICPTGRFLI